MILGTQSGTPETLVELLEVLTRFPELVITSGADYLIVWPAKPDSFEVMLRAVGWGRFRVSFDGWSRTFDTLWEARACFAFGLSAHCRLKVSQRGPYRYAWTVECLVQGRWQNCGRRRRWLTPLWLGKTEIYLANPAVFESPAWPAGRRLTASGGVS